MENTLNEIDNGGGEKYKHFLPLILEYKERMQGYILMLVPRPSVAEDIMQETILVMWEKFHTFEAGTNFYAWAKCIALNKVREHHRKVQKVPVLFFDDEVMDKLNTEEEREPEKRVIIEKLESCLKTLSKVESKLIQLRFIDKIAIKDIALSWGKTSGFIYREMSKILYRLRECIASKAEVSES